MACAPRSSEHRYVRGAIVVAVVHRERPVVGGRPKKDQHEEHHRRPGEGVGHRTPPDEHRKAARDPSPDDVLLSPALEQNRVHHHIEEDREPRQRSRQQIDRDEEPRSRCDGQSPREGKPGARRYLTGHERAVRRPTHPRVHVPVEIHVERRSRPSAEYPAGHGLGDQPQIGNASLREDHDGSCRQEQQLQDARFRELHIGPDPAEKRATAYKCRPPCEFVHPIRPFVRASS